MLINRVYSYSLFKIVCVDEHKFGYNAKKYEHKFDQRVRRNALAGLFCLLHPLWLDNINIVEERNINRLRNGKNKNY